MQIVNLPLDEQSAKKLDYIQMALQTNQSKAIQAAIHAYYTALVESSEKTVSHTCESNIQDN